MHSDCVGEVSELCLHGCLPLLSPRLPNPKSLISIDNVAAASRLGFEVAMASSIAPSPCSYFTNHESLLSLQESFSNFTSTFPHYTSTYQADRIREQEYYHLADTNHVCLDYIGHGLFSYAQLQRSTQVVPTTAASSSTTATTDLESPIFDISCKSVPLNSLVRSRLMQSTLEADISKRIMSFMNISADDYTLVFTANQLSAFKLLADSYPFQSIPCLLTVYDHENEAARIMIESSKKRGSQIMSAEFVWPTLKIMSGKLRKKVISKKKRNKGLFVFPLQSRMTGTRYSYLWMQMAQENGWHVLLDACALGPKEMETLGLSLLKPDFLICSFFKVFGVNPSGLGCLFVKKSIASVLEGTSTSASSVGLISIVPSKQHLKHPERSVSTDLEQERKPKPESDLTSDQLKHRSAKESKEAIENTDKIHETEEKESSSSGAISLEFRGLDHADTLGLILISARARYLINWLVNALLSLRHPHPDNENNLVRIYGPKVSFKRAPAVAFNVFDWKGDMIDPALVQKLAGRRNISLSCGMLSHVYFQDKNVEVTERTMARSGEGGQSAGSCKKKKKHQCGVPVVTAALGFLTNFEDTYRLWAFVSRFLDADFVEKESWRYSALNQQTVEV